MSTSLEIKDIFWGTPMPILIMLGSQITELRARGKYSVRITDPTLFSQQVGTPEDFSNQFRYVVVKHVTDVFGEVSGSVSDLGALQAQSVELAGKVQSKLESELNTRGMSLSTFSFDAIESVGM